MAGEAGKAAPRVGAEVETMPDRTMMFEILASGFRYRWQAGALSDWFCATCEAAIGCDTSAWIVPCTGDGMPIPGAADRVVCGPCADRTWGEIRELALRVDKSTRGEAEIWILDGRIVDWGSPGDSPAEAFRRVLEVGPDGEAVPVRCPFTLDLFGDA